jgi:hypothetical protein
MRLDAQDLMDRARKATGFTDFGDAPLLHPLEVFCRSLNEESGLDAAGLDSARTSILTTLTERLKLEDWIGRHPEILDQRIAAPVNIIGLPRSGTTALSQFLSEDPSMRSIRRWELYTPSPPPDDAIGEADPRIAATRAAFEERDRRTPHYRSMLPVSAEDPSEHNAPMSFTFLNLQTPTLYTVPTYQAWLLEADIAPGYAYLARVLKLLQWKAPRERWNLKNPMDLFSLPAFLKVFPDARLAWLHRDPASTIGSMCSLVSAIREAGGEAVDKLSLGPRILGYLAEAVRRAMRDRAALSLPIVDLYNRDVGRDPVATIGDLYGRLGLPFTRSFEDHLRRRIAERPRGGFGQHRYALEAFGLTTADVRAQFLEYTETYQAPLEH